MPVRLVVAAGLALGVVLGGTTGAVGVPLRGGSVANTTPPAVTGDPVYGSRLTADHGTWTPQDATYTYQWLRDGSPIAGADGKRYRPRLRDVQHELDVRITASADGLSDGRETSDAVTVHKGTLDADKRPSVAGARRYGHTLVARGGSWNHRPDKLRYQWLRDGQEIKHAHGPRHALGLSDFGARMSVRVIATKAGYHRAEATSRRTVEVGHRVPVRHVVRYHVETRGHVVADVGLFKKQAQQTYDDPRGWRGSGVEFRRVARGGSFTLVLSEASRVPGFSSVCSAQWSCRVGRYVIINQTRWRHASPMWHDVHRSLRDYRHMVVNHETGHWLGWGHRSCPGRGALAPVMQQQSKGLDGCKANPWPSAAERRVPRFG